MDIVIFANGQLAKNNLPASHVEQADLIIAADGGANHCYSLDIVPHILIGDFDSVGVKVLKKFEQKGTTVHRHPAKKDTTDLELCLNFAVKHDATAIHIFAALGGRWDMSLANVQLCASKKYQDSKITLFGDDCIIDILHSASTQILNGPIGKRVSLLPLQKQVSGVTLTGFEYPLTNSTISFGSSLGVSNVIKKEPATIYLDKGTLLCIQSLNTKR